MHFLKSNIQNLKFLTLEQFRPPNGLPVGSIIAKAPVFSHNKGNCVRFMKKVYPQHHDASFHPLLVSFHFQIPYRKMRNLRIGVNKLVGQGVDKFITSR